MRRSLLVIGTPVAIVTLVAAMVLMVSRPAPTTPTVASATSRSATVSEPTTPASRVRVPPVRTFDRTEHSTTDPASIWVVVNKKHAVPENYRPPLGLVRGYQVAGPAVGPLTRLMTDADRRGLDLKIASAYRSHGYQAGVYAGIVASRGLAAADRVSARPGHSEHQTGLAVDLVVPSLPATNFTRAFAGTRAGRWIARHAWRYGFVVRYRSGDEAVTGYQPEPWHLRYVGRPLAAEMRRTGITTLEQFFGVPGGGYRPGAVS